jgi:hypothetical protein
VSDRQLGIEKYQGDPLHWWTAIRMTGKEATASKAAAMLSAAAEMIEWHTWRDRYAAFVCAQLMTGRAIPSAFGCSLSDRSSRAMRSTWSALFNPPALNVVALCGDVLRNKIFKNRPFLDWLPERGNFEAKWASKEMTFFTDSVFSRTKVWPMVEQAGDDCMTYKSAFAKVSVISANGKKDVSLQRVLDEEILLTPEEAGAFTPPRSMIQRAFANREDAICTYGYDRNGKELPDVKRAIERAPGVKAGFYDAGLDYAHVVPLIEGWRLPFPNGAPGRHVLAIGNVALVDEDWKRPRFPFAKLNYLDVGSSWTGQSLAEITMPIQREIDRLTMVIAECQRRNAWPRWSYTVSSKIMPDMFEGPGCIPTADGSFPQLLKQDAVAPELYRQLDTMIQRAMQRNGISGNSASGERNAGLSSGIAIMADIQIDDARHVSTMQRQEDFVMDIGELVIDACEEAKLPVELPGGRKMPWDEVEKARKICRARAFPMSRLPTLPAARAQQVQNWYDDGTIDRQQKAKLENMPDKQGFIDAYTASDDWIEHTLDKIVKSGKYHPPLPYADQKRMLSMAQARWMQEAIGGTPDDRLQLISLFIMQVLEMPAPSQGAPGPGGPMPGGPMPQQQPQPTQAAQPQ